MTSTTLPAGCSATSAKTPAPADRATPPPATRTEAALDLVAALARERPAVYALAAHGLRPAAHHRVWLDAVRQTVETPGGRLLLVGPPGSAKSTYLSFILPLWYLGRWPDRSVLAVTSADSMAVQFHSTVELALRTNAARRAIFSDPAGLPDPQRGWSSDGLYLRGVPAATKDPSYRCSGFGSKLIGSRCHLLILDDPVDQETSTSLVEMARVRQYTDMTLLTRLHPQGSAVAISTRWSETDLVAHLQGQGWRVVHTPALGDYPWLDGLPLEAGGERDAEGLGSLWPARWSLEWLLAERRRLGAAQWSTVWMGDPIAVGAGVFRAADWFKPLPPRFAEEVAPHLVRCTGIDLAWSSRETADYTVCATLGVDVRDPQRRLYLLHLFRQRLDEGELVPRLADHLAAVQPHAVAVEIGAFRQDATGVLVQQLRQALYGRLAHAPNVVGVRATVDKVTRIRGLAVHAENGLFHVDRSLELWAVAERELLGLPLAAHDDVPDALSLATNVALGQLGQEVAARPVRLRMTG